MITNRNEIELFYHFVYGQTLAEHLEMKSI